MRSGNQEDHSMLIIRRFYVDNSKLSNETCLYFDGFVFV